MPVEPLIDHPALVMADVITIGAVYSIIATWWFAKCPPIPTTDSALAVLAKCDAARWARVKNVVKPTVDELMLQLTPLYHRAERVLEVQRAIGHKGHEARRQNKIAKQAGLTQLPKPAPPPRPLNAPAPRYASDGITDMTSRTAAKARSEQVKRFRAPMPDTSGGLVDAGGLDAMVPRVPTAAPWTHPDAAE